RAAAPACHPSTVSCRSRTPGRPCRPFRTPAAAYRLPAALVGLAARPVRRRARPERPPGPQDRAATASSRTQAQAPTARVPAPLRSSLSVSCAPSPRWHFASFARGVQGARPSATPKLSQAMADRRERVLGVIDAAGSTDRFAGEATEGEPRVVTGKAVVIQKLPRQEEPEHLPEARLELARVLAAGALDLDGRGD